jgi:hypothetical protein
VKLKTHTDIFKIRKIYFSFQKKKGGALQALVAFSSGLEGKLCDVIRRRPLLLEKKRGRATKCIQLLGYYTPFSAAV